MWPAHLPPGPHRRAGASAGAHLAALVLMRRACSSAASLAHSVERRLACLSTVPADEDGQARLPFADTGMDDEPDWQLSFPGLVDVGEECRQLELVLGLARAAASDESKVARLRRLLARIDEPAIVFTEYRDTLRRLAGAVDLPEALQLHGGLSRRERAQVLTQFTSGPSRLLLATDAGSEGLNLHHRCRLVISLELPWMPLRLEQRAGRVDCIGQSRRVHVMSLVAKATCEEGVLARLTMRMARADKAMDLVSTSPSEERVAAMVLGGEPTLLEAPVAAPPPGVIAARVGAGAGEAARIGTTRLLKSPAADPVIENGPVLTRIRRGRYRQPARVWLFRVPYRTPEERAVWEPVFGIRAGASGRTDGSAIQTRLSLSPEHVDLADPLRRHAEKVAAALREELARPTGRWMKREEAILETLRERHARMAMNLVQPGLFDRRADRLAAEYQDALQDVLLRSSVRVAQLAGLSELNADTPTFVFALLVD